MSFSLILNMEYPKKLREKHKPLPLPSFNYTKRNYFEQGFVYQCLLAYSIYENIFFSKLNRIGAIISMRHDGLKSLLYYRNNVSAEDLYKIALQFIKQSPVCRHAAFQALSKFMYLCFQAERKGKNIPNFTRIKAMLDDIFRQLDELADKNPFWKTEIGLWAMNTVVYLCKTYKNFYLLKSSLTMQKLLKYCLISKDSSFSQLQIYHTPKELSQNLNPADVHFSLLLSS
ncbi:hypothetical protein GJ496_011350 [Pomphorhynchus laevis]|nr:hypothetical protein GJ496_011350 [Pomphorhynchus laevis]